MQPRFLGLVLGVVVWGCASRAAPPPPPAAAPVPQPIPSAPLTAQPLETAPPCVTVAERCRVEEAKPLPIGPGATVQLPVGWVYTQAGERLTGASEDGGAILSFAVAPGPSDEAIRSVFYALQAELGITGVVDAAFDLDTPQANLPAGELVVQAWQVEKPKRGKSAQKEDPTMGGAPGALLVGVTRVTQAQVVVGVGFLLRSAPTEHAKALKDSLTSIRTVTAPAAGEGS